MNFETDGVFAEWMETYQGIRFTPTAPRAKDINIGDIAHALSLQCRYAGHVKVFYSVAEHCVRVSNIVPLEHALWGLLHDASEAYLQDMIKPLKCTHPLGSEYKRLEAQMDGAIAARFGLKLPIPPEVKHADCVLLFTEQRDLRIKQLYWKGSENYTPLAEKIIPWTPEAAKGNFLSRFTQLTADIDSFAKVQR